MHTISFNRLTLKSDVLLTLNPHKKVGGRCIFNYNSVIVEDLKPTVTAVTVADWLDH